MSTIEEAIESTVARIVAEQMEAVEARLREEIRSQPQDWPMTVSEAARYLGVSQHTLNLRRSTGGGPEFLQGADHGRVQYMRSALDAWQANRRRKNNQRSAA